MWSSHVRRIAIYANDGGGEFTLDVRQNMIKNVRYQFVLLYTVGEAALTAAVEDITLALVDGALPVGESAGLPLHRFPLTEHGRRTPGRPRRRSRKGTHRRALGPTTAEIRFQNDCTTAVPRWASGCRCGGTAAVLRSGLVRLFAGTSVTTPVESTPELLTLHAVRLKGMADDDEVAARFGLDPTLVRELLLDFQAYGWITRVEFVGTAGWTLTESGRSENERQLAQELAVAESNSSIRHVYMTFLPHNDRLLRACTDWQLRPTSADPLAANEHTDKEWDQRVLTTLSSLCDDFRPLCQELGGRFVRFQGYDDRFAAALARVERGEHSWVARPRADSCHTVWMELHEDLVATLGIRRGVEPDH